MERGVVGPEERRREGIAVGRGVAARLAFDFAFGLEPDFAAGFGFALAPDFFVDDFVEAGVAVADVCEAKGVEGRGFDGPAG